MKGGKKMNKKAQVAIVISLIFAIAIAAMFVYAAPKKCNNEAFIKENSPH